MQWTQSRVIYLHQMMSSYREKEISLRKNKRGNKYLLGKDKINLDSSRMLGDQVENVQDSIDLLTTDMRVDQETSIIKNILRACIEDIIMKCCSYSMGLYHLNHIILLSISLKPILNSSPIQISHSLVQITILNHFTGKSINQTFFKDKLGSSHLNNSQILNSSQTLNSFQTPNNIPLTNQISNKILRAHSAKTHSKTQNSSDL